MKRNTAFVFAIAAALAAPAWAQKPASDHSSHHGDAKAPAAALAEGEVRKLDKVAKKITLKHGRIPNIDMDAMTMQFNLKDLALVRNVKVGDKVRFQAEIVGGSPTVTHIEAAK
jgi:Cu/Ag efflux protein CusF